MVSDRVFCLSRYGKVIAGSVLVMLLLCREQALALEVGFEGLAELEASDNVLGANAPEEQDGSIQSLILGVYGEQRGRSVSAAFTGELDGRKISSSSADTNFDVVSTFLGAAEFRLTPRSWTWYVADVLGGVRRDDAIQPIDSSDLIRRNVFVTGPEFSYERQGVDRTTARLFYVNQIQDNDVLEDLYIANIGFERDLSRGNYTGFRVGNIYTDVSDDNVNELAETEFDDDFNRATFSVFYNRRIGTANLFGEAGATRYDADDESLDGLNAQLRLTQELGPQKRYSVYVQTDLSDQSLSTVESLVQSGDAAVGISPEAAGFFTETRIGVEYGFRSSDVVVDVGFGIAEQDYRLLSGSAQGAPISVDGEDRRQGFATASWVQRFNGQLSSELSVSFETQDFNTRVDNSTSVLLTATLNYALTRSFDLRLGVTHDTATGVRTRFTDGIGNQEDIDATENRLSLGLRWAPPSRAGRDLTIALKSLLR